MKGWVIFIEYILPIVKVLWKVFKPEIQKGLEVLWDAVEVYVEKKFDDLDKDKKNVIKVDKFNEEAKNLMLSKGITCSKSDINLVRELVHKRMTLKV